MVSALHVLLKPASGLCNLRCKYCFYHDITEKRETDSFGMMTEETLEQIIKKTLSHSENFCTIAYQGGEPTLRGLDFFRLSVRLQNQYNTKKLKIHNAIQTNGYGLTDEWAKFFHDNHFLVGLSLDGKKETHDINRINSKGEGTFKETMKTAELFNRHKVEYNILSVVNTATAKKIESIYNTYKKSGFMYLQFIPCLDPIGESFGQNPYSLTPKLYGDFLKTLFDLWFSDFKKGVYTSIRDFDNYIRILQGYPPELCGLQGVCGIQNVIEADGSVYPCDFYMLDEYRLGNLNDCGFDEIYKKRKEIQFVEVSAQINAKCKKCRFFTLCRGGCRRHKEPMIDGKLRLNYFCEAYNDFFEYAVPRLLQAVTKTLLNNI